MTDRRRCQTGPTRFSAEQQGETWWVVERWYEVVNRTGDEDEFDRIYAGPMSEGAARRLAANLNAG